MSTASKLTLLQSRQPLEAMLASVGLARPLLAATTGEWLQHCVPIEPGRKTGSSLRLRWPA